MVGSAKVLSATKTIYKRDGECHLARLLLEL